MISAKEMCSKSKKERIELKKVLMFIVGLILVLIGLSTVFGAKLPTIKDANGNEYIDTGIRIIINPTVD